MTWIGESYLLWEKRVRFMSIVKARIHNATGDACDLLWSLDGSADGQAVSKIAGEMVRDQASDVAKLSGWSDIVVGAR